VIVAEADLLVSTSLVAVIVTVCCVAIADGAVYTPSASIEPVPAGLIAHVTAWLLVFPTVAANC
jgi:hypothetical protein